jgi:hypothetical protein
MRETDAKRRLGTGDTIAVVAMAVGLLGVAVVALQPAYPTASIILWRGVFWGCLVLAVLSGAFLLYHHLVAPRLRGKQLEPFLLVAIGGCLLVVIGLGGLVVGAGFKETVVTVATNPQSAESTAIAAPAPLTTDQHDFRLALKQFALTCPDRLVGSSGRVLSLLIEKIKSLGEQDYFPALFLYLHLGTSAGPGIVVPHQGVS